MNIKKVMFLFTIILFLMPINVDAASVQNIGLTAIKCNPSSYEDLDSEVDGYYYCIDDYRAGLLDSYIVENNGDVEPGDVLLIAIPYTPGGIFETTGINAEIMYDKDVIEILSNPSSTSEMFYDYVVDDFPKSGRKSNWVTEMNDDSSAGIVAMISSDLVSFKPLTSNVDLGYFFIKIADNATPGNSLSLSYNTGDLKVTFSTELGEKLDFTTSNLVLSIYGEQSRDASLSSLSVTSNEIEYIMSPSFVPGDSTIKNYKTFVPNDVELITIDAIANNEYALVLQLGLGEKNIIIGNNSFNIVVTSQYGDIETYKLDIYRLSNDTTLSNLSLSNGTFTQSFTPIKKTYTSNVLFGIKNTVIRAVANHTNATVVNTTEWSLPNYGSTANTKNIVVSAENCNSDYALVPGNVCTTGTYSINLYRGNPSTNNNLTDLTVNGNTVNNFDKDDTTYYTSSMPNSTTSVQIGAVVEDTNKATVAGTGDTVLELGDNIITVTVTAEDGSTKDYQIIIRRLSSLISLKSLTITSNPSGTMTPVFSSDFQGDYNYSYSSIVNSVTITATSSDEDNATILIVDSTIGKTESDNPVLKTMTKSFNTPETTDVTIYVTAEDGNTGYYTIKLNRVLSSDASLKALSIDDGTLSPGFSSSVVLYNATIGPDIDEINVTATPNSSFATYEVEGNTDLKFGVNTVTVSVVAEDGSDKSYIIMVNRNKFSDATLSDIKINGTTIDEFDPNVYSYHLPNFEYDTTEIDITATTSNSLAEVSINGPALMKTGSNEYILTVTAHDTSVKETYKIYAIRNANNDTGIKKITLGGIDATLNEVTGTYEVAVSNNITKANAGNTIVEVNDPLLPADSKATVTMGESLLSTKSVNNHTITITAEDGTIAQYTLLITRAKSDIATLNDMLVSDGLFSPAFSKNSFEYTIMVPSNINNVVVSGTKTEENSIVTGLGSYNLTESTKTIEVEVTSESGLISNTYILNIERVKSNDNTLKSLSVSSGENTYSLSPIFDSETTTYSATVPGLVESVDVSAMLNDDRATIVSGTGNKSLVIGPNVLTVRVQSESGTFLDYIITVERLKKVNNNLSSIKVDGVEISDFSPSKTNYILNSVDYSKTSINVTATTEDEDGIVKGTGEIILNTSDNTITIIGVAQNGDEKQYILNIKRKLNSDTGIKSIYVEEIEAILNPETGKYEVIVPNNILNVNSDNVEVDVNAGLLENDPKAVVTMSETELLTTRVNNHTVTITAEDGTMEQVIVQITREKSDVATLDSISVTNGSFSPSFNSNTFEYNVLVPIDTTSFEVTAVSTEENARILSGIGEHELIDGTKKITIEVESENGVETTSYVLNIERIKSSDNKLKSLTVSYDGIFYELTPEFSPTNTNYTVTVMGYVDKIIVNASVNDPRATIVSDIGEKDLIVGSNPIIVRVKSESGAFLDYTIVVERLQKANNKLTSLEIDGIRVPNFDKDELFYTLDELPYSKESFVISATTEDEDASVINVGEKNLATGENHFEIVVSAQNGDQKTYVIDVVRRKNNDATLRLISVVGVSLNPVFDKNTSSYEIILPNEKHNLTESDVTALATDSNATVIKQSTLALSSTSVAEYKIIVTAEDGLTIRTYYLYASREKSSDATLKSVVLKGASLNPAFLPNTTDYIITVPAELLEFTITGTPTNSEAFVTGNNKYDVYRENIVLMVTSESGVVKSYNFEVNQALSNDASLSGLEIDGYTLSTPFVPTSMAYTIGSIPYSTTKLKINSVANNVNSTVEYYVNNTKQDSNIVEIPDMPINGVMSVKVTAADGLTIKTYNITYTKKYSDNAYLSSLSTTSATIDFAKKKNFYSINVDSSVENITFNMVSEDATASIQAEGKTGYSSLIVTKTNLVGGTTPIQIIVTAQDGKTKNTYTVAVVKASPAPSTNANLSLLSVKEYPITTRFVDSILAYGIGPIPYANNSLTVQATTANGAATIDYYVGSTLQSSNVVSTPKIKGTNYIIVKVTAEDRITTKEYKIAYSKIPSNNAYLKNLEVSVGNLVFDKESLSYRIGVPKGTTSVDVTATLDDNLATMLINGNSYTSPHTLEVATDGELIIINTAEDGTILTYSIKFVEESVPTEITSLIYGHTIEGEYIKSVVVDNTILDLKNQLDNDNQYLEVWDSEETTQLSDEDIAATGQIVKLIINNVEVDRKIVVVKGDVDGSGSIDLFDSVLILNHYLGRTQIIDAYLLAADTYIDDVIDLFDAVKILNHFLERSSLFEEEEL